MGQLTIARFRGDTTFGLVTRVFSTFSGGIVGMVIWYVMFLWGMIALSNTEHHRYISRGNATDSPYGLAAVLGFCFPFFFYANLYWPGPIMTNIMFFVTTALVRFTNCVYKCCGGTNSNTGCWVFIPGCQPNCSWVARLWFRCCVEAFCLGDSGRCLCIVGSLHF